MMFKNKKILVMLLIMISIVISLLIAGTMAINAATTKSSKTLNSYSELTSAPNIGNTIMVGKDKKNNVKLATKVQADETYCAEHDGALNEAKYVVYKYVKIVGNKATGVNANGPIKNKNGKELVVTSNENLILGYILGSYRIGRDNYARGFRYIKGNSDYDSVRQTVFWYYARYHWMDDVGSKFGVNWKFTYHDPHMSESKEGTTGWDFFGKAKNYVKEDKNANIKNIGASIFTQKDNKIGPIKAQFAGKISSIKVTDTTGATISSGIEFYSDSKYKNKITKISDIKSKSSIYIKNNSGKMVKNIEITVTKSDTIQAELWFIERADRVDSQKLMTVKTSKVPTTAKMTVNVKEETPPTPPTPPTPVTMSLSGYVWIDVQRTKANNFNSLYDNDADGKEARVEGVTVILKDKTKGATENTVATTKTNANGEYVFDKVNKDSLANYYVEFNYKNVKVGENDISKYIPVAFNSTVKNGSRALMDEVAKNDEDLSGIATTYKGTEKEKEAIYGLSGNLYKLLLEGETLKNINLGLKKIPETEFAIYENLANVKIGIKGYDYTYVYGLPGDANKVAAPKVKWQNDQEISAYSRDIYPSDIVYKSENASEMLNVNVTYNIDIVNTTNINIPELYKEHELFITGLMDEYDTNRYKLNENNEWTKKDGKEGTAIYKGDKFKTGIKPNSSASTQISFNVNREALLEMLKNPYGVIENKPTKAIATGHHEYKRDDYMWSNLNNSLNVKSEDNLHITKNDTRQADAPYLIFKLGQERILSGKVFEDKVVTTDGRKLGNGVYDENENIVRDVKVELLDVIIDENGKETVKTSHLYGLNEDKTEYEKTATAITGNDGSYTLSGIVPGRYYIRFTYGDGTQKIYDLSGNEKATLTAKDYKSTIVTNEIAKQALKGGTDLEWYQKMNSTNASVAIDSMDARIAVNEGTRQDIIAGTAKVSITIENTEINEAKIEVTEAGQKALESNKFDGLNLGVIEQPNQQIRLEKIITNMKLINAQNNLIFNGNPETAKMAGVSDLDGETNGGSSYARAELAESNIYGSTIELTYRIKVTNTSDINYYNYDYYRFGEANENKEVTLNVKQVLDYLDKTLTLNKEASDSKITVVTPEDGSATNNTLSLGIGGVLYTANNKTRKTDEKTSGEISLVAQRILSNQDDDMEIVNEAEVKSEGLDNATDARDNSENKDTEIKTIKPITANYKTKATATITPPTGFDRLTVILYVISGIVALAVLSTGVVYIRKYVKK